MDLGSYFFGFACGGLVVWQCWNIVHKERMYQQTIKMIRLMGKPTDAHQ